MANSFNTLLDSGCTRHVVRDRALFHDFAEKSVSVGTATYGSLDALGSGDVEFRYPFGDRYVIFTLRDCLYVPTAPKNLLSVGTLLERGMSCPSLYLPDGITEVFYPDQHPKFPGLTFSATVINHLSFLLLDFIPPVASSFPAVFSPQVSPPVGRAASRRKPISPPKKKLPSANPPYLVIDSTLPSHIFRDRSLFTTYVPSHRLHRNAFGTDIIIEGTGEVHVRVVVNGKSILFCFRDSWHVPSSPNHFLSASSSTSLGNQIMIAGRSPRMIFSHKKRLVEPNFPKYMPFKRIDHFLVLEFEIPTQVSLSTTQSEPTRTTVHSQSVPSFSLQASSPCLPFAGLAFNQHLLHTPQPHADVVSNTSAIVAGCSSLHGGANIHVMAESADTSGVTDLCVKDQAVASGPTQAACGGDLDDLAKTDLFMSDVLDYGGELFPFKDTGVSALQVCASSPSSICHSSSCFCHSLLSCDNCTFPSLSHSFCLIPSFSTPFHSSFTSVRRSSVTLTSRIVGVRNHHRPPPSTGQSSVFLTSFTTTQRNSLAVISGVTVDERGCTMSVATALPVHRGVDTLVEMVSLPMNGGVPAEDQATNSCGDNWVDTDFLGILYSSLYVFTFGVDDNFTLHLSIPLILFSESACVPSFTSPSSWISNLDTTFLLSLLYFSCNIHSLFHSFIRVISPSFPILTLSPSSIYIHFKVSSLPAIIFSSKFGSSHSVPPSLPVLVMQGRSSPSGFHPSSSTLHTPAFNRDGDQVHNHRYLFQRQQPHAIIEENYTKESLLVSPLRASTMAQSPSQTLPVPILLLLASSSRYRPHADHSINHCPLPYHWHGFFYRIGFNAFIGMDVDTHVAFRSSWGADVLHALVDMGGSVALNACDVRLSFG